MKIKFSALIPLGILCMYFFSNCTPQLAEPLQKIQDAQYSTGWERLTSYPITNGRSDDLHFFDAQTGFVINSNGYLSHTNDGGDTWEIFHENENTFYRCITFKNRQEGWLGTIGTDERDLYSKDSIALYETKDGGYNWTPVEFIGPTPKGLCGLHKVNENFIVGCGRVRGPSYFIKTMDGGKTWYSYDLNHVAGSLIAAHFFDESHGLLIGGTTREKKECRSMVLETLDGGMTWDTIYLSKQKGEYPWKFSFPTREKGFISIQRNVRDGKFYHLQTEDGGKTWKEVHHSPGYYYVQGIGFINENIGWIGGSRSWTYETRDGGKTWNKLGDIGNGFNNFQFLEDSIAYGVGFGVYKSNNVLANSSSVKKEYFENGNLRSSIPLKFGKKNGPAHTYYFNGQLATSGFFKNNLKSGTWKYFDEQGKLIESAKMKNGVVKVSKKKLKSFVGNYENTDGTIRKIFMEDDQMYSQRDGGSKLIMFPETKTRFFYGFNTEVTIEFLKNKKGEVTHSQSFQNGGYSKAEKID